MMLNTLLSLLLLSASSVSAKKFPGCLTIEQCPELAKIETQECQPYHIFVARGSTSPYPGHISDLMEMVCSRLDDSEDQKNCGFENIIYPAKNGEGEWGDSAHDGAVNGQNQMRNYTKTCPDSKLIVFGFSQGGSVVLDLIGGGGGSKVFNTWQPPNEPLGRTSDAGKKVAAIIAFGPTVRSKGQNFTVHGGDKWDGMTPRSEESLQNLYQYGSKLREYCQPLDPICSPKSGTPENKTSMDKHLDYFEKWNGEAAQWVVDVVSEKSEATQSEEGIGSGTGTEEPQTSSSRIADMVSSSSSLSVAKVSGISMILLFLYFGIRRLSNWLERSDKHPELV